MEIDLAKYQGVFYEVYRQNADFELFCDIPPLGQPSNVSATYIYVNENKIKVINSCVGKNGYAINVYGEAKKSSQLPPNELWLTLNVQEHEINSRYIVFYTDYVNYSIVGNLQNNYLSFLSRTRTIEPKIFSLLATIAELNGFHIEHNF